MSFDRISRHYRWLESVLAGGVLQRCRTAFLRRTEQVTSALLLGEGNGRFLVPFLKVNTRARVVCVEQSAGMIFQARRTMQRSGADLQRVQFIHGDVFKWEPPAGEFDLIVTHFFLDCFTPRQLQLLVPRLALSAHQECIWLLADFQLPPRGMRKLRARAIHALMYPFFRLFTKLPARRLTPPDPLLQEAGFQQADNITTQWGLLRSDIWVRREALASGRPSAEV